MSFSPEEESLMRRALELARRGWGQTHPNPMVGAVVVEDGEIVAEGWHAAAGEVHAERMALQRLGRKPRKNASIYITLEPCSTHGRTPPCTEAIREAGLRRVVVGAVDPNPLHAGAGLDRLREAGVVVQSGLLADDCEDLNLIFNHWITTGRPLVAAKIATTLDGCIATRTGHSQWITGEQARADVMRWRRLFPAIAVGAGTVEADDPRLTSRLPGQEPWSPRRLVFDRRLRSFAVDPLPGLYTDPWRERTVVVTDPDCDPAAVEAAGLTCWPLSEPEKGALAEHLVSEGLTGLLIEGGSAVLSRWLAAGAIDYLLAYRAPVLLGDDEALTPFRGISSSFIGEALRLQHVHHAVLGEDQLMRGFLNSS